MTFGSFNHLPKITSRTVALWARILSEVSDARLILKTRPFADGETRRRCVGLFAEQGIAPERLTLLGPTPLADLLSTYGKIDVALDSVPYDGGTTSCEALWMGVPLVTLRGENFCQRMGASLLRALGLDGLVAADADAYVATATALARDPNRLAGLRSGMRAHGGIAGLRRGGIYSQFGECLPENVATMVCPTRHLTARNALGRHEIFTISRESNCPSGPTP